MSHYYEGRLRSRAAYAFGLIDRWAKLASHMPKAANFFTQKPPFTALAKRAAGIAPERRITPFAAQSDTLIVADGFSCREQIVQTTGREASHLAQVLQMALQE